MKKIMNRAEDFVDEVMEGIEAAYSDRVGFLNGDRRILVNRHPVRSGKVGIVTAGGSGHLPVFLGYVGDGMLDACVVGGVFASPPYTKMAEAIRFADQGNGVLCLYGNYGGDKLNFNQAIEDVEFDDITCQTVLVGDDVASAPVEQKEKRRGVAGMVYAFKIAGAAAAEGRSLEQVAAVTRKALDNTVTMGVALSPCIIPEVGKAGFSIGEDEIEVGMGIHGEKGIEVRKMMRADEIADTLLERLLPELSLQAGEQVSVLVNGLGATPLEEQMIIYRRIKQRLDALGAKSYMPHIGNFATSMEMAGLSITLLKLDEELAALLRAPASTPFYTNENK